MEHKMLQHLDVDTKLDKLDESRSCFIVWSKLVVPIAYNYGNCFSFNCRLMGKRLDEKQMLLC